MAKRIAKHEAVSKLYTDRLIQAGHITEAEVATQYEEARAAMLKEGMTLRESMAGMSPGRTPG